MHRTLRQLSAGVFFLLAGTAQAFAASPVEQHNSNALWFENWIGLSNATLTIVAPNGKIVSLFAEAGTPVFQLGGAEVLDGVYHYELSAATSEMQQVVNPVDNGRGDQASDSIAVPFYLNGSFIVSRGVIITPEAVTEEDS